MSKGDSLGGALDRRDVARTFQAMATAAGVDPACISDHSTRVGAAQYMVAVGVAMPKVMNLGAWRTPEMVSRYILDLDAQRSGAADLAKHQHRALRGCMMEPMPRLIASTPQTLDRIDAFWVAEGLPSRGAIPWLIEIALKAVDGDGWDEVDGTSAPRHCNVNMQRPRADVVHHL